MDVDCSDLDSGKEEEEIENQTEKIEKKISGKTLTLYGLRFLPFDIRFEHN